MKTVEALKVEQARLRETLAARLTEMRAVIRASNERWRVEEDARRAAEGCDG